MKLMCVLVDGFEDIETIGTIALLRRAGLEVDIYGLNKNSAKGRFGTYLSDLHSLEEIKTKHFKGYHGLLITGGPQYIILSSDQNFLDIVESFHKQRRYICAICAAPTILGKLKLLKNMQYTCFPTMNDDKFGGYYLKKDVVLDGKLITSKSSATVYDFAFKIVETLLGKKRLAKLKEEIFWSK